MFAVPKGNYVMTLGGYEGTIQNPTFIPITPADDPVDWASFPATENINMSGNAIVNCSSIYSPTVYLGANNAGGNNTLQPLQAQGKNVLTYNKSAMLTAGNYTDYITSGGVITSTDNSLVVTTTGQTTNIAFSNSLTNDLDCNSHKLIEVSGIELKDIKIISRQNIERIICC